MMLTMDTPEIMADVQKLKGTLTEIPESAVRPALIVVSGLPGVGKSYFSRRLAQRLPSVIIESDALRKQLFAVPTYSGNENRRLFSALHRLIEEMLGRGITVIFDATNLIEKNREHLYRIAERLRAKLVIVWVKAPEETVIQRLRNRTAGINTDDNSEADWETHCSMKKTVQRIQRNYFAVDSSKDINLTIDKIVRIVHK